MLGQAVRSARLALGFTQRRLAEKASVSHTTIVSLERNTKKCIRPAEIDRLGQALGVDLWPNVVHPNRGNWVQLTP